MHYSNLQKGSGIRGVALEDIECHSMGSVSQIATELASFILNYDKLDAAKLLDFVR